LSSADAFEVFCQPLWIILLIRYDCAVSPKGL
jgi:hypothetical protein